MISSRLSLNDNCIKGHISVIFRASIMNSRQQNVKLDFSQEKIYLDLNEESNIVSQSQAVI